MPEQSSHRPEDHPVQLDGAAMSDLFASAQAERVHDVEEARKMAEAADPDMTVAGVIQGHARENAADRAVREAEGRSDAAVERHIAAFYKSAAARAVQRADDAAALAQIEYREQQAAEQGDVASPDDKPEGR